MFGSNSSSQGSGTRGGGRGGKGGATGILLQGSKQQSIAVFSYLCTVLPWQHDQEVYGCGQWRAPEYMQSTRTLMLNLGTRLVAPMSLNGQPLPVEQPICQHCHCIYTHVHAFSLMDECLLATSLPTGLCRFFCDKEKTKRNEKHTCYCWYWWNCWFCYLNG